MSTIPVICDRCRSTGIAGEADFSHLGDLLDFTPVPRKKQRVDGWSAEKQRVDGWSAEKQRAFIAALSATGSKRQAAQAVGMAPYGVEQMLKGDGNDSFKAAVERAILIARANGSMKIAQGVADAAARNAVMTPPSRLRDYEPEPEPEMDEDDKLRLLEALAGKFMKKVTAERRARLNGEIVAADFYLRQITSLEVTFDLTASQLGWDPREVLRDLRRGGRGPLEIVSTPFADWLDTRRRLWWLQEGEPERPPHPDPRFLRKHDEGPWGSRGPEGFSTYVDQNATGATTTPARGYTQEEWAKMPGDEQRAARQKQFDEDAAEQAEWERRAQEAWGASEHGARAQEAWAASETNPGRAGR